MALESMCDTLGIPVGFLVKPLAVASGHGYYTPSLLKRFDIPEEKLTDVGNRVTSEQYYGVLDYLLERGDIPGLGLLQASAESVTDHGLLGTAFLSSENLHSAAEISVKYQRLFGPVAEWYLDVAGNRKEGRASIVCMGQGSTLRYRWSVENALAGWANLIRQSLGGSWHTLARCI